MGSGWAPQVVALRVSLIRLGSSSVRSGDVGGSLRDSHRCPCGLGAVLPPPRQGQGSLAPAPEAAAWRGPRTEQARPWVGGRSWGLAGGLPDSGLTHLSPPPAPPFFFPRVPAESLPPAPGAPSPLPPPPLEDTRADPHSLKKLL